MKPATARRPLPLAALLALGMALAAPGSAAAQDVIGHPIGTQVQPVAIEALDGSVVDLAQWIGRRPVVVQFWATWCPTCAQLQPRMEAAQARYGDRVEFVAVAVAVNQTTRSINRHLERHPMTFPLLWDAGGRATRAFRAPTTGYVVVLDAQGRVAYTGIGATQDIEAAVARVAGAQR
jgi:cytochrome c biogenesis protein CcmG, thiol:disulfide interchange protein DsbE